MMQQMYLERKIDKQQADYENLFDFAALNYGIIAGERALYDGMGKYYPDTGPGGRT